MTLTVSVWVGKAEDSGRGEPVRKKYVRRGVAVGRLGWKGAEKEKGWQLRVEPETIDKFRVRKICCLDKELNRAKTMVAPTPGFTHKTT